MKSKIKLPLQILAALAIVALLINWILQSKEPFHPLEWLTVGLVALIVAFILYMAVDTYRSAKVGLTTEDEFSKSIKEKAAAKAFQFSVYMWTFIILFVKDMSPQSKIILGLGLIAMGVVFLINWFRFSKIGISDDNKD